MRMRNFFKLVLALGVFVCSSILFSACGSDDIILVTGVDLYTNEIYADVNQSIDLSYKVYPNNATNQKVTFWSTDESIASVDDAGKVTVKSYGEASIVVRSVDGGYEDYCKIITNIDPDQIEWDTSDKLTPVTGTTYSATASMALNQVMKLKVNYLLDGSISDAVTNRNVVFTSSNASNIQVINDREGIIKAVNNEILEGERAFSDITATITTTTGRLSITCRVFINEFSSLENLNIKYKNGDKQVLNQRNGSETIYLTSSGDAVEFYAYLTNMSQTVKTDYDMTITSSDDALFSVQLLSETDGIYKFKLIPMDNEGTGSLYIRTTCSNENGKSIRCNVNVVVQAEIKSATATATTRKAESTEVLLNGEIFSIGLTYFDESGNKIEGAERDIYFDALSTSVSPYISNYGNNQFKVKAVPANQVLCQITGYVYVENVESSEKVCFTYQFYLKNSLESLIVSKTPKSGTGTLPSAGVSNVTLPMGGSSTLYAYATTYDFTKTEPASVKYRLENDSIISVTSGTDNSYLIQANAGVQGIATVVFYATDGIYTIEYEVTVYVVQSVATIKLYSECDASGNLTNQITDSFSVASGTSSLRLYFEVSALGSEYIIECESNIGVASSDGTIGELVVGSGADTKIVRYIDINLADFETQKAITLTAQRVLAETTINLVAE